MKIVLWKLFGFLWLLFILLFIALILFATNFFRLNADQTPFGASDLYSNILIIDILMGVASFILSFIFLLLRKPNQKKESSRIKSKSLKNRKTRLTKSLAVILTIFFTIFISVYLFFTFTYVVKGKSMFPTLNNDEWIETNTYLHYFNFFRSINRGDIVVFSNDQTKEDDGTISDFVKRVIAVEGDNIEIRDGFIKVNGVITEEPYLNKPRSTFGNEFLADCKKITIPENEVFVLGDNRAHSKDSRAIGFVKLSSIKGVVPSSKQVKYSDRWHDASRDALQAGLPSFDKAQYYEAVNKIRTDNGLKPLKINNRLEKVASLRMEAIIKFNELETPEKNSRYKLERAHSDAGYSNTTTAEIFTSGYYDSEDLVNYWMEYNTKDQILNKDYQETGLSLSVGKINGCETQVIVQEFGGYIPPNYKQSDIDSWQTVLNRLREIQPSWEKMKNYPSFYEQNKTDINRITEIISIRISRISSIISTMEANKWLNNEQNRWIKEDQSLYNEQESLANNLNKK